MFYNQIKFAFRHLFLHRSFSAINIFGLAISLTAFSLMALYIEDEFNFDRFNSKADRIYRVADDKQTPDIIIRSATSAAPVAPALRKDFPEILDAVRLIQMESLVKYGDKIFEERQIYYADQGIFNLFSFHVLKGNPANALQYPESIVLTIAMAEKYFGTADPLGQQLMLNGKNMKVTAVMENVPGNSHVTFDFLVSMSTAQQKDSGFDWLFTNWYSNNFYTYILVPENYDINKLRAKLLAFDARHKEDGVIHNYQLEKLTDIYLRSNRSNQAGKTGSIINLYIFSAIAFFILLIACINFINLSTATATNRAKEVAMKKMAGASRMQVMSQFLVESFVMVTIAFGIALTIASILLPLFNTFSGKVLTLNLSLPRHLLVLCLLLIAVALLSGGYPALVLSAFTPLTSLKGKIKASGWIISLRKGLIVFQFAISVFLIVCSLVIYTQMNYLLKHDLGFNKDQTAIINFEADKKVQRNLYSLKQQLIAIPGVQGITASSNVPGDGAAGNWSMNFAIKNDTVHTELPIYLVDHDFLGQYGIDVIAGRNFSALVPADSIQSMMINETALKKLGIVSAEEAIGVYVEMYPTTGKIIGVIRDFHFESLQKPIEALALRIIPSQFRVLSVKLSSTNMSHTLVAIEKNWKALNPDRPFEVSFLDQKFNQQYDSQVKFSHVFTIFTLLAIIIASIGLLGLALFTVMQKTKEIGIRKVLGADIISIITHVNKEFMVLVVLAILIASPLAWYAMHEWLQGFAFKTVINTWIFVAAALGALSVAFITVSFHAAKVAMSNPISSLRTE